METYRRAGFDTLAARSKHQQQPPADRPDDILDVLAQIGHALDRAAQLIDLQRGRRLNSDILRPACQHQSTRGALQRQMRR
jgi:hypothetical protein